MRRWFYCFTFIFGFAVLSANGDVDSLKRVYHNSEDALKKAEIANEIADTYFDQDQFEDCKIYAALCLQQATKAASDRFRGEAYYAKLLSHLWTTQDSLDFFAEQASRFFLSADMPRRLVDINIELGFYKSRFGDCEGGFAHLSRADSIATHLQLKDKARMRVRLRYCNILQQCEQFERVPELVLEVLPTLRKINNDRYYYAFYDVLMVSYANINQPDSAVYYLDQCKGLLPKIDLPEYYSIYYNNGSEVYKQAGLMQKNYEFLREGLAFDRANLPFDRQAGTLYNIGLTCIDIGRYREGVGYIEEVIPFYQEHNDVTAVGYLYEGMVKGYTNLRDFERANEYLVKGEELRDSLKEAQHLLSIEELSIKYETERINRELVESQLKLSETTALAQRNKVIGLVLLGVVLTGVAGWFLLRNRRRRKQLEYDKHQAELRYSLLRAQMNPHFIFNSLNSIQSFFSNQRFHQGNEFLGTFSQLVRRVLEQTGQKAIALSEELDTLTMYLELEQLRLGNKLHFNIFISDAVESDLIRVPPLIFQPFVENAIWHGIAPKGTPGKIDIFINYDEEQDALLCSIEDDGVGIQRKGQGVSEHRSRGVEITRARLGERGRIEIENKGSSGQSGVRTDLVIPIWD
ncbi:MAG: histidine kinase [Bacteroidota bacterium]